MINNAIFEIFKTGKHNGQNGSDIEWTGEDLQLIATTYNHGNRPAPLVLDHPENDLPKFGTVKNLIYCKNALFAETEIEDRSLIEKIKSGKIKGISCSFFPKENNNNPSKGISYFLKHVGFLENQNPAVKNMLPPEISVHTLNFNEEQGILFFNKEEHEDKKTTLHKKTLYIKNVLNIEYSEALNITTQQQRSTL